MPAGADTIPEFCGKSTEPDPAFAIAHLALINDTSVPTTNSVDVRLLAEVMPSTAMPTPNGY